jgi:hypothetical protein
VLRWTPHLRARLVQWCDGGGATSSLAVSTLVVLLSIGRVLSGCQLPVFVRGGGD